MKISQQLAQIMMANKRNPPKRSGSSERSEKMRAMLDVDPATLTEQLAVMRNAFAYVPTDAGQEALDAARAGMADERVGADAPAVGTVVPDFRLLNQNGEAVELYDRLKAGPVIVSFYRGMWCPFCNFELRALQATLPEFKRFGASLIAISPQAPDRTISTAELNALTYDVVSDHGNAVAAAYGVVMDIPAAIVDHQRDDLGFDVADYNGSADRKVPVPATLLIDRDRKVAFRFVNPDYRFRVEPAEIVAALADRAGAVAAGSAGTEKSSWQ